LDFQDQNSSENFAYIITGMSGNGYQTQSGNRNKASIDQVNTAINVNAYQEQAGDDNSATIVQNGGESLSKQSQKGNWNNVEIYQTGHFNHAEQNQQLFSMNNNAVITQDGFFNNAVQQQKGYLGQEKIDQENSSSSGLAVNYAKQEQDALLGRSSNSLDPLNEASILQSSGNGNYAFQKQFSTGGDVVLNVVISIQKGDFNHSEQYQSGQANYSFLQQDGKANSLLINQKN
jgi:hypothetical protein